MQQAFFVTGTDTGVGKTHVTCALLHATRRHGRTAVGMKPVAAGVEDDGRNSDVAQLLAASSIQPPNAWVNPFLYAPAIAPHIAAREVGRSIDITLICEAFAQLQALADVVWVEGVGGFRVPLDERYDTADLAQALALPVILVVGMRLGCLNHALLTAEAIDAPRFDPDRLGRQPDRPGHGPLRGESRNSPFPLERSVIGRGASRRES